MYALSSAVWWQMLCFRVREIDVHRDLAPNADVVVLVIIVWPWISTFLLHCAAPLQDVRQAVRRGTLGSLNPTPWAVMTGNCTGWYVVGHVIRLRFHISLEWLTLSLSWKLQGYLLVFNSGTFEYYQKWFTLGYDVLGVLTNLAGRINSYFGQMHQASFFRYG